MADTVVHTPETVTAQMQADISAANVVTGRTDTTVHDAVTALIAGFGSGGGSSGGARGIYMAKITPETDLTANFPITHNLGTTDILLVAVWAETLGDIVLDRSVNLHKVWNKTDIITHRGGNGFSIGYMWSTTNSYAAVQSPNATNYETLTVVDENTIRLPRCSSGTNVYLAGLTYTVVVIAANAEV